MAKPKYYNIKNLLATNADYMVLLGERANGKTYQVKKTCLEDAYAGLEDGTGKMVYLRRWKEDIKTVSVENYFCFDNDSDMISKITHGDWDGIRAFRGQIHFFKVDNETGKIIKSPSIGAYCGLNEAERYKSMVYAGYDNIIFEEFITDNMYLHEEPKKLMQFISTITRHRKIRVFMVGNTLTRVCPYFSDWCLDKVLTQKIGTIDVYHHALESGSTIDIAVEYCANANADNNMFFGRAAKQIAGGEWDTKEVPHLVKNYEEYEMLYELLAEYKGFRFCIQLLFEPKQGGVLTYIYPATTNRKIKRIISDVFSDDPNITYCLNYELKAENLINKCFRIGKVCYSDNLTGSDFANVNKYFRIGQLVV